MKALRSFLVAVLALALAAASAEPILAAGAIEPLPARGRPSPNENIINLMRPLQDVVSGPAWMMAQGKDPRAWIDRPDWEPLTRLSWDQAEHPLAGDSNSPVLQAVGPGVLVPFRDPAPAFSRDLLVTRDYSGRPLQTEPHIAVNPRDPDHLLLGVIDYNFPNTSAYVSIDGGATWEGPRQIKYLRQDRVSGGDPVVAFDHNGNAYFASISIGIEEYSIGPAVGFAMVSSIQVAASDDGGFTWNESVSTSRSEVVTEDVRVDRDGRLRGEVHIGFLDKPWMTVGPHPTIEDQEVIYVTYTNFVLKYETLYIGEMPMLGMPTMETTIKLVKSEDGGITWTDPIDVSPTVRRVFGDVADPVDVGPAVGTKRVVQGSQPAVDAEGNVYVVWLDSTDDGSMEGLAELYTARSEDAGETFGEPVRAVSFLEPGFRPRNAFFRYWGAAFPQIAIGPEGSVYVVYTALPPDKPTDEGDIYFIRSTDGGDRWSRPVRLNQDDTDRLQFFPAIDAGPDGVIHVMWGDMRDDPVETRYHIYYTRSEDEGQTWGFELADLDLHVGDTRVTDFPSNPNFGFPFGLFIGDYFAIAAVEGDAYLVWADTRLGEFGPVNQKIGFSRQKPIRSPEIFISPPAGPGGQSITVRGHNFQPNMNVYLQMGGATVTTGRTDAEGRINMQVFVPISGEGAHQVQLVDESGNFASTSFYMEFGFDNVRDLLDAQSDIRELLEVLNFQLDNLDLDLEIEPGSRNDSEAPETADAGETTEFPWGVLSFLGLALGAAVTLTWISRRNGRR